MRDCAYAVALLLLSATAANAQVRERPIAFDTAGRIMSITPPLAARLRLAPPAWPASGDYLDARLYALDDAAGNAVLVVRRPREVLERYTLTGDQRSDLARAIARGSALAPDVGREPASTVSEPVKGAYVLNQSLLGGLLFGPLTAAVTGDAAAGTAAYLLVTGGTFFLAAERVKSHAVSRAQNHLAWHLARQGAGAGYLIAYAAGGESADDKGFAAAMLVGGVVGDVVGDRLGRPLTDAEAHGLSHGAVVTSSLAAGLLGTAGLSDREGSKRTAAIAILGAQALGYPMGLRYVRGTPYRVTAGDVGTLVVGEALGLGAAATFVARDGTSSEAVSAALTAGFALGALVADRAAVRRYNYTDAESRLLQLGTVAGAVVGIAIPVLAQTESSPFYFGAATAGGVLGAIVTHGLLAPARATRERATPLRTGAVERPPRLDVRFTPQNLVFVQRRARGMYPLLDVTF
ncbi:MAG: hypothetical protein ABI601_12520 [bacterium]